MQIALRAALAAAISLAIAQALNFQFPIFAMISALIVTDLTPSRSIHLGLHRVIATVVGAGVGALLIAFAPINPWTVGFGIAFVMLTSHFLQGPDGVKVAGFTCAIIMLYQGGEPWHYAFERFVETIIGIAVAWSISHVPKLIKTDDDPKEKVATGD